MYCLLSRASRALVPGAKANLAHVRSRQHAGLSSLSPTGSRSGTGGGQEGVVPPRVRVRVMLILLYDVIIQKR
jgi:hypothetical protein